MCSDAFVLLFMVLTPFVRLVLWDYRPKKWTTFVPFQKVLRPITPTQCSCYKERSLECGVSFRELRKECF